MSGLPVVLAILLSVGSVTFLLCARRAKPYPWEER